MVLATKQVFEYTGRFGFVSVVEIILNWVKKMSKVTSSIFVEICFAFIIENIALSTEHFLLIKYHF